MSLIVYSKPNCPGCVTLKDKLKAEGTAFTEVVIGKDITVQEFIERFPDVRSVPYTVDAKEETW
jgi:glutaredoxin